MESTVTKTVENIDKLFSQITVNGESYNSERYTPPVSVAVSPAPVTTPKVSQNKTIRATLPVTRSGTNAQAVQGEDVYAVELNDILHNFVDRVVAQGLADEVSARQSADTLLAGFINALNALIPEGASSSNKLVTASQLNVVSASVSDIEDLIPSQASDQNQLADKSFVNSSIATNTANFLGTYTTLADIQAIQNPTNNDYAFLQTTDSAGNTKFDRYKYSSESSQWLYEYTLNNSSFTAEQWATINSGLTASSVSDAIGALDVASVGGSGKYISAISEADGKINATATDLATSVANGNNSPVTSNAVYNRLLDLCFPVGITIGEDFSVAYQSGGVWYDNDVWWRVFEGVYTDANYNNMYVEITVINIGYNHGAPSVAKYIVSPLYKQLPNIAVKELYNFNKTCHGIRIGKDSNNHWYIDLHLRANYYNIYARGVNLKRSAKQSKVNMDNFTYVSIIDN